MRFAYVLAIVVSVVASGGCKTFIKNSALKTTSDILKNAQPSLQQEADYELARQAIPGALKTVEGFWINDPENDNLRRVLTEGYCQYGTAFVEDDWEVAKFKKDIEAIEYHNDRSTKIFTRCLNYALLMLGGNWQRDIYAEPEKVEKLINSADSDQRFELMFAGMALGSMINHNLSRIEMIAHLTTVQQIMDRVKKMDEGKKGCPPLPATCAAKTAHLALPHIAVGMLNTSRGKAMGGDPEAGQAAFEKALELTGGRFLLARVLMAYRVGILMSDRAQGQKFFHDQLKLVLETPPSVWPEQRLANEVAHRKARRYLSKEKELFQ